MANPAASNEPPEHGTAHVTDAHDDHGHGHGHGHGDVGFEIIEENSGVDKVLTIGAAGLALVGLVVFAMIMAFAHPPEMEGGEGGGEPQSQSTSAPEGH